MVRSLSRLLGAIFPVIAAHLLTLVVTSLVTAVLFALRSLINPSIVALLYLLPVSFSTVRWGLGPGITAAFFAFLAFNYFFIQPYYSLTVHQTQDLLGLLVFLGVTVGISQLVGQTRKSLALATAREHEAIRLYELSAELAGMQDERAIVRTLTERALETFRADRVEVVVEPKNGKVPIQISMAARAPGDPFRADPSFKPSMLVPLQTVGGLLGEIRLWRAAEPVAPEEERLLRTFASQCVLALERSRLAQAESRARVLEESDHLKTSLLSSVSHELRTPLATIKAAVTSLRSHTVSWDSEAREELLSAVEEETDHLNQLVGNLLNMSRIEAGALKPERSWNALSEIIAGVIRRTRVLQQRLEIDLPEDLPLVPVDYVQMEQVFTNLIDNSLKYSPENARIEIRAWKANDREVCVQVKNQGPPVPEEHLGRIFDKFYRVNASDRITGSGLGLSICKGIVEAHGGGIWAENLPAGFMYTFTLPYIWEGKPQAVTVIGE